MTPSTNSSMLSRCRCTAARAQARAPARSARTTLVYGSAGMWASSSCRGGVNTAWSAVRAAVNYASSPRVDGVAHRIDERIGLFLGERGGELRKGHGKGSGCSAVHELSKR